MKWWPNGFQPNRGSSHLDDSRPVETFRATFRAIMDPRPANCTETHHFFYEIPGYCRCGHRRTDDLSRETPDGIYVLVRLSEEP